MSKKTNNPVAGKTATGRKASSGRAVQPAKRTGTKQATPKKETQAKKTPLARTSTGKQNQATNKKPTAKPATGKKANSGRVEQPTKRTPKKQDNVKQNKQPRQEQRVLIREVVVEDETGKSIFPKKFPFWARLKIEKKRTTLVIDEVQAIDKKSKKMEEHFVHRESIHPHGDGSNVKRYEKIEPNPDPTDKTPMYLKRPTKLPKKLFKPHNKELDMPEHLKQRYEKNNKDK